MTEHHTIVIVHVILDVLSAYISEALKLVSGKTALAHALAIGDNAHDSRNFTFF